MDGLMDEEKIGWMNRWVSRERGISFHMTLYARGPEPLPLSLSYPRQAVSATGLVVLAPLGHSGIPPCHAAPTPPPPHPTPPSTSSLRLSFALLRISILGKSHSGSGDV